MSQELPGSALKDARIDTETKIKEKLEQYHIPEKEIKEIIELADIGFSEALENFVCMCSLSSGLRDEIGQAAYQNFWDARNPDGYMYRKLTFVRQYPELFSRGALEEDES